MSRNKEYQRLLNSKRWKELRAWKLQQNPLCELCQAEGYVTSAIDIHHKTPVESARTPQEMEALCFNPSNLQSLCIPCHQRVHREARSHTKAAHLQRERDRLERWKKELESRVARINDEKENPPRLI
jgi:5-methylcytosine-specific restriction protein A